MPRFTVRVELHNARMEEDYERLHAAMEARGFERTITGSDGIAHHLPTAEYNYDGAGSREDVLALAKAASQTTGKTSSILVTESNGRTWHNLPKA